MKVKKESVFATKNKFYGNFWCRVNFLWLGTEVILHNSSLKSTRVIVCTLQAKNVTMQAFWKLARENWSNSTATAFQNSTTIAFQNSTKIFKLIDFWHKGSPTIEQGKKLFD